MRHRCPRGTHPRLVLTYAVFALRSSWREWTVAYVSLPSIGGIVMFLKLSANLLTEASAMVGGGGGGGQINKVKK